MKKRKNIWRAAVAGAACCLVLMAGACSGKDGAGKGGRAEGETKDTAKESEAPSETGEEKQTKETAGQENTESAALQEQETSTEGTSIPGYVEPPTLYREENGVLSIYNVSMQIPEGMELYDGNSTTIVYRNAEADASFALYVEVTNEYGADVIVPLYIQSVQNAYGSQVQSAQKEYNGHMYTIMDIGSPEGLYVGNAVVLCEGPLIVYLEYVSESEDEGVFEGIMNSLTIE